MVIPVQIWENFLNWVLKFESLTMFRMALRTSVDAKGFFFVTLNTCNMEIFNRFRKEFREYYADIPGYIPETDALQRRLLRRARRRPCMCHLYQQISAVDDVTAARVRYLKHDLTPDNS